MSPTEPLSNVLPRVEPGSSQFRSLMSEAHDRLSAEAPGANHSIVAKIEGYILEQCLHDHRYINSIEDHVLDVCDEATQERFIEAWNKVYELVISHA